jgi:hypothetical protein
MHEGDVEDNRSGEMSSEVSKVDLGGEISKVDLGGEISKVFLCG